MEKHPVPLYARLPEIYRIRDEQQDPPWQLRSYLSYVEQTFGAIRTNIAALLDDLFIETCDPWVIPYIGDLLGVSHLSGEPWTLRADVADTIALRRRKGTLASIERLTYDLTRWGVHCIELRENLAWHQHLNHQRPDTGGRPPYGEPTVTRFTPVRGGTAPVRDPAMLSLLGTPFDPFAHLADVKPPIFGSVRYNLPNLAIFLWRLEDYRVPISRPVSHGIQATGGGSGAASHLVRFVLDPLDRPVRLFNTYQFDPARQRPLITELDATPGPIPPARLDETSAAGNPRRYVALDTYDPLAPPLDTLDISDVGLQFHLPDPAFAGQTWPGLVPEVWRVRGANLCAWEAGVQPPVRDREVVIDPVIGRVLVGLASAAEGTALENDLLVTYTYGAVGPVGAHPISRPPAAQESADPTVIRKLVDFHLDPAGLQHALDGIDQASGPVVIEILDSRTHELNISTVAGHIVENGEFNLGLNHLLEIRAADGQRPIIRLGQSLRFRPATPARGAQAMLRLEGLLVTPGPGFPAGSALIMRADLQRLEIVGCTLDPGGFRQLNGTRAPIQPAVELRPPDGFVFDPKQTLDVVLQQSIAGPLHIDHGYYLFLTNTILDAGKGPADDPGDSFAITGATDPLLGWGPPTEVNGLTVFGRMRVERINGRGGIWVHALEVLDNQQGCLRYSYFSGTGDRLPQNLGCVSGPDARLHFTAVEFGDPAYAQLAPTTDFRIRERGPGDDAMGAFGFLLEAHKWLNLQIRFWEFMPVGVRPLLIPIT